MRKYAIFLHLNDFSLRNNPSWSVTKETMKMLICCFAGSWLGHIILHNAPPVFSVAYRLVKPLIDPKTATKILFVTDQDEEKMTELIEKITGHHGAGQKRQDERSSPGYDHSVEGPSLRKTIARGANGREMKGLSRRIHGLC